MTPRFTLQRVLELKERKEQAAAAKLAKARTDADLVRQVEDVIASIRTASVDQRLSAHGTTATVGELQNMAYMIGRLDYRLDQARSAVRQADAKVNECMNEFSEATRERQVLDRLKEKKTEAALMAIADLDRKTMDDIALSRFVKGNPTEGRSE